MFDETGEQVGWWENGVFYDSDNKVIGFTNNHTGALPSIPGVNALPAGMHSLGARPLFRPTFHVNNARLGYGGWSNTLLEDDISKD